mgnify:CR=1 FL=1
MKLVIKRTSRDYLVIRVGGTYEQHAHFKSRKGAEQLIELIHKNRMPTKKYFIVAAKRLLTEEEFNNLTVKKKRNYYNVAVKESIKCYR